MPSEENSELKAFVQKLQEQGSDAFAAGPWKNPDETQSENPGTAAGASEPLPKAEDPRHAAAERDTQASQINWSPASASAPGFEDRVLTGLAFIALSMFIVGSLGLYLSYRPELKALATPTSTARPVSPEPQQAQYSEIEQKLGKITTRLEDLSAGIAALSSNTDILQAMNQSLLANPPAALPQPAGPGTDPSMETVPAQPMQDLATTTEKNDTVQAMNQTLLASPPAALPVPAGPGTDISMQPVPVQPEQDPEITAEKNDAVRAMNQTLLASPPAAAPLPTGPGAGTTMETVAVQTRQDLESSPLNQEQIRATPRDSAMTSAPQLKTPPQADWVINLASCTKERTAKQMQDDFRRKGIDTEVVSTTVGGSTMYRIRIPGFESRKSAQSRATSLNRELGVEGLWVMKGG